MDWQTCSHSGGGMRVHVFLPDSWACHDGRSTLSICRKSWKIYSCKVPLTIMLHDFVDRNYLSFRWCVPIYKAILRLNSLFPVYIKPAMQLSWYNKRGKVKKLFKRKSTEPLLTQTPTQSNFLWHYWGESHVPISIFLLLLWPSLSQPQFQSNFINHSTNHYAKPHTTKADFQVGHRQTHWHYKKWKQWGVRKSYRE